ncbi:MAG: DNA repair protein RecO [Tissierellia bacterium]|nr:DNA repair protein RecO [Tissierellia bacterium]
MRVEAIILRAIKFKESSLIVHALTDEHGKISIMCQGAYKRKVHQLTALDTLSLTEMVLREGRTMYYLNEADVIMRSNRMTDDKKAFYTGHMIAEILTKTLDDGYATNTIFPLTKTLLLTMEEGGSPFLLGAAWILKYTSYMGYRPKIGQGNGPYVLCTYGVLSAQDVSAEMYVTPLSEEQKQWLERLLMEPFSSITKYKPMLDRDLRLMQLALLYASQNFELRRLNTDTVFTKELFNE